MELSDFEDDFPEWNFVRATIGTTTTTETNSSCDENFFQKYVGADAPCFPPSDVVNYRCCQNDCSSRFSRADIQSIRRVVFQSSIQPPSIEKQRRAVKQLLYQTFDKSGTMSSMPTFVIRNIRTCSAFCSVLLGVSVCRIGRYAEEFTSDDVHDEISLRHGRSLSSGRTTQMGRMNVMLENLAQEDPSGSAYFLPAGYRKIDLERATSADSDGVGMLRLRKRKIDLSTTLRFHKSNNHLRCSTCVGLNPSTARPEWSSADRERALSLRKQHFEHIKKERIITATIEEKSRIYPDRIFALKMDGMSKDSTKIPIWGKRSKRFSDTQRQSYEIFAVQYPIDDLKYKYHNNIFGNMAGLYSGSSNFVCSAILSTLIERKAVPPILFVQGDNAMINKSSTIHGFMGYLFYLFPQLEKIYLCFNQVGHTHSEIDGYFGVIKQKLMTSEIPTPARLEETISSIGSSTFYRFLNVYNFEQYLSPITVDYANRHLQGSFLFRRNSDGEITYKYSRFYEDAKFISYTNDECDEEAIEYPLFIAGEMLKLSTTCYPTLVQPNTQAAISRLQQIKATAKGLLSLEEHKSYDDTIHSIENYQTESLQDRLQSMRSKNGPPTPAQTKQSNNYSSNGDYEKDLMDFFQSKNLPIGRLYREIQAPPKSKKNLSATKK